MNWNNRSTKKQAREIFLADLGEKSSYLTLPGPQCVDVALAQRWKVLGPEALVQAAEKEKGNFDAMCLWFAEHWKSERRPRLHHCHLCEVEAIEPVDLAFLDYLGNLNSAESRWFRRVLAPALLPNARLGMTVSSNIRANRFVPHCCRMLKHEFKNYYQRTSAEVRDSGVFPNRISWFLTTYTVVFRVYLFPNHNFSMSIHPYAESQSTHVMVLFCLRGMESRPDMLSEEERKIERALVEVIEGVSTPYREEEVMTSKKSEANGTSHAGAKVTCPHCGTKFSPDPGPVKAAVLTPSISQRIIDLLVEGEKSGSAGKKAAGRRLLGQYVAQRAEEGSNPVMVEAGIKARVNRILNGNV